MSYRAVDALACKLVGAGLSRADLHDAYRVELTWPRPPFITDDMLGEVPVQELLTVPIRVSLSSFLDLYEQCLDMFFYNSVMPLDGLRSWIIKALHLSKGGAALLLPRSHPNHSEDRRINWPEYMAAWAALAVHNFKVDEFVVDARNAYAAVDGLRFGLAGGDVLSNKHARAPRWGWYRTQKWVRVDCRWPLPAAGELEVIRIWLEGNKSQLAPTLYRTLWDALVAIRWKGGALARVLPRKVRNIATPTEARLLLSEARSFRDCNDPLQYLFRLLVPTMLGAEEFSQRFGNRFNPPVRYDVERPAKRFDQQLQELEEQLMKRY